jgi:hypothetical protein
MSTIQLIGRGEIAARVSKIVTGAQNLQADIHLAACSILDHTREHGDYTAGEALLNGLPNGQRVKALAFWFRHFSNGKLTFKRDEATKLYVGVLQKARDDADFRIDEACETSFADLTNEQEPKSVTVESMVRNLSRSATNAEMHKDGKTPKVTPEARALASKIVAFVRENGLDKKAA